MRRNTQIPRYQRDAHVLDRKARPDQVATWIETCVHADGGRSTFKGFGRAAKRLLGKAQRLLAPAYRTRLILAHTISGNTAHVAWRQTRHEYQLIVTHIDAPWPPQPHPLYTSATVVNLTEPHRTHAE